MARRIVFTNEGGLEFVEPKRRKSTPKAPSGNPYPLLETTRQVRMKIRNDYNELVRVKRSSGCVYCRRQELLSLQYREGTTKAFEILTFPVDISREDFIAELDKCIVVCGPCARRSLNSESFHGKLQRSDFSYEVLDGADDPDELARLMGLWGIKPKAR